MSDPGVGKRIAITELLARGAWALDTGDESGFAHCFAADAELMDFGVEPAESARGRDEIAAFAARQHAEARFRRQHHFGQILVEGDGRGRAGHWRVSAYVFVVECRPKPPHAVAWTGYYEDVVRLEGEEWRVRTRHIRPWAGPVLARFDSP